jgi:tetratricopeptide (TPR) repeat protein
MPTDSTLVTAQALHLQGRLTEAETLYREVLRRRPDTIQALEGLGILVYQFGRADEAASLFAQGVEISPQEAGVHANLGEVLRVIKRFDQAADHIGRALVLDPALPEAWNTRGLLAHDQGRYAEAAAAWRRSGCVPCSRRLTSTWAMPWGKPAGPAMRPTRCARPCGSSPTIRWR